MITTLTLNPCIDHTIQVNGIEIGGTNRIEQVRRDVGGKGINVSTALKQLGYETRSLIFSYADESVPIRSYLEGKGITCAAVPVPGRLRTNIKIFDANEREMTEFNESGYPVSESAMQDMLELVRDSLTDTDVLIASGSVPPGIREDVYAQIICLAKERGVRTILDADHALFREGIQAKPTLIKPNRGELERYLGRTLTTRQEILDAAVELVDEGITYVCVSAGAEGAYLVCRDGAYYTKGAPIEVRGVQGAGDSLVAGCAIGLMENLSPEEMLRLAAACANGSLLHEGTGMCEKEEVRRLIRQMVIERL